MKRLKKSEKSENTRRSKPFRKLVSVLLSLCVLLGALPAVAFAADGADEGPYPMIYVVGRVAVYDDPSSPDRKELADAPDDAVLDAVKEALPYVAKAVMFGQWDEYQDKAYDLIMQFYEGFGCNEDGEVDDGSGVNWSWSESGISPNYLSDNAYTYEYRYDFRLSPLYIADGLNDYIEAVKRVTGKNKVCLAGRCVGTNIMMAYLQKYQEPADYSGVDTVIFYDSSFLGVDALEAAMSGNVTIESDASGLFLSDLDLGIDNELLSKMLILTLQMLRDTYGIELTAAFVQDFYSHIRQGLVRRFLISTLASAPGYWSMVYDHFDEAKEYIFQTDEDRETYAGLIEKIDDYRDNVQLRYKTMISDMQTVGVDVAAICKYGFLGYPLSEHAKTLSDSVTSLRKQSFYATCSDLDDTLPDAYVKAKTDMGLGEYISPDRQVDASTALLADTTWFVKNLYHNTFANVMDFLLNAICRNEGFTVYSDGSMPRFMCYTDGRAVPMTEENRDPAGDITSDDPETEKNFFTVIIAFFKYIVRVIKTLFELALK